MMKSKAGMFAVVVLQLLAACAAEGPDDAETQGAVDEEVELDGTRQELGVPRVHRTEEHAFGWNVVEQDHWRTVGSDCSSGFKRVDPPKAFWQGNGACEFREWINPDNIFDCRARFHAHTNSFGGGSCTMTILEERASAGSCRTRAGLLCGGAGSSGACFCDDACEFQGDCCLDKAALCD